MRRSPSDLSLESSPAADDVVYPFLKWAGGKRWLTSQYAALLPENFTTYYEPFVGSGAVFFHLNPAVSVLADCNAELIETYVTVRGQWQPIERELRRHQRSHSPTHFYAIRAQKPRTPVTRAARFLYLNRTCWNGLYRVNSAGRFNVPIGTKSSVVLPTDNFGAVATRLGRADLRCSDFEPILDTAAENDFVFVDPPYTVMHNLNGFVKYNDHLFSWHDQIRLHAAVQRATQRGAKVLVLNANHSSLHELYGNFPSRIPLSRHSVLAGNPECRRGIEELAIRCWD